MQARTLSGHACLAALRLAAVATPEPGPNDLRVEVRAADVNPVGSKITRGLAPRDLSEVAGRKDTAPHRHTPCCRVAGF